MATRRRQLAFLVLCATPLATPATSQFLNRAVYRGTDETTRRSYDQDVDYFLDRFSYVDLPPWWNDPIAAFRNRAEIIGGSVSTDRLTLEARVNIALPLGEGFSFDFHYLQSEDQSDQFDRTAVGFEYEMTSESSVFTLIEGTPEKEDSDVSFGTTLFRSERGRTRLMLTLVDFASSKAETFEYEQKPFGLMISGDYRWDSGTEVYYEVDGQLPFEQTFTDGSGSFEMWRVVALGELRVPVSERDTIVTAVYTEFADKQARAGTTGFDEDFTTRMGRIRAEWWRRIDTDYQLSMGASLLTLRNRGDRLTQPDQNLAEDRDELLYLVRARVPLSRTILFEPNLWAGYVDFQRTDGATTDAEPFAGFQGKFGLPLVFRFSPDAMLSVNPTFQLDEPSFGGGSIQFLARF